MKVVPIKAVFSLGIECADTKVAELARAASESADSWTVPLELEMRTVQTLTLLKLFLVCLTIGVAIGCNGSSLSYPLSE